MIDIRPYKRIPANLLTALPNFVYLAPSWHNSSQLAFTPEYLYGIRWGRGEFSISKVFYYATLAGLVPAFSLDLKGKVAVSVQVRE